MNWELIGTTMGWLVAVVALVVGHVKDRRKATDASIEERANLKSGLEALCARVDSVAAEAKSYHEKTIDTNLAFWQEKWPLVERAIATVEQLEQRISALESWRAVHFKNGTG